MKGFDISLMTLISTIANLRGITENEAVNSYTYKQATHIGTTYLKDRLMSFTVIGEVLKGMDGSDKKNECVRSDSKKKGLPHWVVPKGKYNVVDLDGPINLIQNEIKRGIGKG